MATVLPRSAVGQTTAAVGQCSSGQYLVGRGGCRACDNVVCPTGMSRAGSCSGRTNGYVCRPLNTPPPTPPPTPPRTTKGTMTTNGQSCSNGQFLTSRGCSACGNTQCASGQYRSGSCSGTTNGFQCNSQPACRAGQFLRIRGASTTAKGTCTSCQAKIATTAAESKLCQSSSGQPTTSTKKTTGKSTRPPATATPKPTDASNCKVGEFSSMFQTCTGFKGCTAITGVCKACSNTKCAAGQYRTGSCSGTTNEFLCNTCANTNCASGLVRAVFTVTTCARIYTHPCMYLSYLRVCIHTCVLPCSSNYCRCLYACRKCNSCDQRAYAHTCTPTCTHTLPQARAAIHAYTPMRACKLT